MTARIAYAFLLVLAASGSALAAPAPRSLVTDLRPVGVGDLVTILVQENSIGEGDAETNTDKDASVVGEQGSGFLDFVRRWGIAGRAKFEGTGSTTRNGRLIARLSGRVIDLDMNGNLMIEASKVVKVNEDEQTITVRGVIRPEDVGPNNSVFSAAIADARIEYSGEGDVTTGQRPGIIMRILTWLI
jgi:flagellar L-ring protein FlgH